MLAALAAALSLATIDVPFVPQTDALCGGAAAAMVFRYWGDRAADAQQFASLVERRPGGVEGIATDVLENAVRARGWRTEQIDVQAGAGGAIASLEARIAAGQPVIVLLDERRDRFHYVVVNGWSGDTIVLHDPSWGPYRRMGVREFLRRWTASRFWSLAILPSADGDGAASTPPAAADSAPVSSDPCDAALASAVDQTRTNGLDSADRLLEPVIARCPDAAGPMRELAGVRFMQRRWRDAAAYAARATARDPNDEHALFLLGASLFMEDDSLGALRAWNRIGKPKLDLVRIEGLHHSRYQTIVEALALRPTTMLTADTFARAERRLDELPDRASARIGVRPQDDGIVSVDVAIAEQSIPHGAIQWSGAAVRAAVDRELAVDVPGFTGQGELWSASWRWWNNRPRVAMAFAVPRIGPMPGVWRVDGSWEAETFGGVGAAPLRDERTHVGFTSSDWLTGAVRYSLSASFDSWKNGPTAPAFGGSLDRRWFDDRLSVAADVTAWFPVRGDDENGRFAAAGARATVGSSRRSTTWVGEATVGMDGVTDEAPMMLWPGAGDGRARPLLLRAHPLLDDGIIDATGREVFGRTLGYVNVEGQIGRASCRERV